MAMADSREALLTGLLRLGCVEISEPDDKLADPAWAALLRREDSRLIQRRSEITDVNTALSALERYGAYKDGMFLQRRPISQEEFLQMKEGYSQQISVIEQDIGRLKKERAMIQDGMANRSGWLSQFRKYQNLPSLSRAAVVNLVDKIELYPDKKIRVVLRYQDQLANMVEFLREQDAAKSIPEAEVG